MRYETVREGIHLALDQLRAHRFRSALTILGIVVGVATVMAMSALVVGIRSSVLDSLEAAGPRNFIVARFDLSEVRIVQDGRPAWMDNPPVRIEEARRIEQLHGVRVAIVDLDMNADVEYRGERLEGVQVSANDAGWTEFTLGTIIAGRDFLPADVVAARPVVVLSTRLAEQLFGELDPVGRNVRINGFPFEVTGIFEMTGNIFGEVVRHFAVVPYTAAFKYLGATEQFLGVLVVTADHARQEDAMDEVIGLLRGMRGLRPGEPNDFSLIRQEEMAATFDQLTGVFFLVMIALSSIGLMVGGVGVIAIMMISVTERTREIGIRKAVGATRRAIRWQFLVEATTLTLIGAGAGMLLGASAAFLIQATTPIPAAVPLAAVAAALAMAGVAGILFGIWPAWRASRMDPVTALRYE